MKNNEVTTATGAHEFLCWYSMLVDRSKDARYIVSECITTVESSYEPGWWVPSLWQVAAIRSEILKSQPEKLPVILQLEKAPSY